MKYYQINPSGKLAGYVKFFWVGEAATSKENLFTHFSIATSAPKLIFHYTGEFDEVTATGKLKSSFSAGIQGQSKRLSLALDFAYKSEDEEHELEKVSKVLDA